MGGLCDSRGLVPVTALPVLLAGRYSALGVLSLSGMLDSAITRANGVDADAFCRAFLLPRAVASATVPAPAMRGGDGQRLNSLRFAHRRHAPLSWCDAHADDGVHGAPAIIAMIAKHRR